MSVKSMTGFGEAEVEKGNYFYRCEVKSLNSRFLDINVRLPRSLGSLEHKVIGIIKNQLKRGKVELNFDINSIDETENLSQLNENALQHYINLSEKASRLLPDQVGNLNLYQLLRMDGVLEKKKSTGSYSDMHELGLLESVKLATASLVTARSNEGEKLKSALLLILEEIAKHRKNIDSKRTGIQKQLTDKLESRISNIIDNLGSSKGLSLDRLPEDRLATEIAILADKVDIEEELTRLEAHEDEFAKILNLGNEIGRKLDFLCQEMHREINTISNKMTHLDVARQSLDLKQQVERIRQQIQNIE